MKKVVVFRIVVLSFIMILTSTAYGQKIRLRSRITPDCGVTSTLKFADIYAEGNIAVMGSFSCRGAFIFDISNPDASRLSNWYNPGANQQFLEAVIIGGRGYFGSGNGGGVHIVDLSDPTNPQLLGIVNSSNGNGHNSIHEMLIYQKDGATYLIENFNGFSNKLIKVINVTNPTTAVFVRDIEPTEINWVHSMHIRGNKMFTSGWGTSSVRGRTEIYDISNIAIQAPSLLGFIEDSNASATNGNNLHSSWTSEDGNYLYSAREITNSNGPSPGDVRVYDVSNPELPMLVNRVTMSDLGLNAVTPHNPVVMGNKLYVSWYQAGLQVFDISSRSTLKRIGQYDTYEQTFLPKKNKLKVEDESWDIICGRNNLQNTLPTTYNGAWAVFPFLGEDKVLVGDLNDGLLVVDVTGANFAAKNAVSDFDGDRRTDLSVFSPSTGNWYIENAAGSGSLHWGLSGDRIVSADYDGDGKADIAIWRPSDGNWWILNSSGGYQVVHFGLAGDEPIPADYDADGKADIAVWRPSNGVWYILQSTLGLRITKWGSSGDKPIAGDFEGDGKPDIAVWRPSDGVWYVLPSSSSIPIYVRWGVDGDKPVLGDSDGDGRSDYIVYRPSEGIWYILNATFDSYIFLRFGLTEDIPISADYDGDGRSDIAVFRPSSNDWYTINSSDSTISTRFFGQQGDIPSPASVNPQ